MGLVKATEQARLSSPMTEVVGFTRLQKTNGAQESLKSSLSRLYGGNLMYTCSP
jgi:hypothetical protein